MESIVPTFLLEMDHLFREGLRRTLSGTRFRPQSCAIDLQDLAVVSNDRPTLFIIGIGQKHNSVSKVKSIRDRYPLSLVVAIGDECHRECMAGALHAGANAAICTSVTPGALVSSLQAITSGGVIVIDSRLWSTGIRAKAEEGAPLPSALPEAEDEPLAVKQLSTREIAILHRIIQGDSNKHVARAFQIAEATVKARVKVIFLKIGASNRTQAAVWALNHGLVHSREDTSLLIEEDSQCEVNRRRLA